MMDEILQGFLQTLAEDPWVDAPIKNAARTALGYNAPKANAEAKAAEETTSKPQAQPRAAAGRAGGGGR